MLFAAVCGLASVQTHACWPANAPDDRSEVQRTVNDPSVGLMSAADAGAKAANASKPPRRWNCHHVLFFFSIFCGRHCMRMHEGA